MQSTQQNYGTTRASAASGGISSKDFQVMNSRFRCISELNITCDPKQRTDTLLTFCDRLIVETETTAKDSMVSCLVGIDIPEVAERLLHHIHNTPLWYWQRTPLYEALHSTPIQSVVNSLIGLAAHQNNSIEDRESALAAARSSRTGEAVISPLIEGLVSGYDPLRESIVSYLGTFDGENVTEALRMFALRDSSPSVQKAAIKALSGRMNDAVRLDICSVGLRAPDPSVRIAAVSALIPFIDSGNTVEWLCHTALNDEETTRINLNNVRITDKRTYLSNSVLIRSFKDRLEASDRAVSILAPMKTAQWSALRIFDLNRTEKAALVLADTTLVSNQSDLVTETLRRFDGIRSEDVWSKVRNQFLKHKDGVERNAIAYWLMRQGDENFDFILDYITKSDPSMTERLLWEVDTAITNEPSMLARVKSEIMENDSYPNNFLKNHFIIRFGPPPPEIHKPRSKWAAFKEWVLS